MRKLIVQQFTTIDNVAAEPDGGMTFVDQYVEANDQDFQRDAEAFMDGIDTMILGANTYRMFVNYWPEATNEGIFAEKLNSLQKHVASTTLVEAPWGKWPAATVTADPVTMLRQLKEQSGKDIVLWGSLKLMRAIEEAGLVDEYYLRICSSSRGQGTRVFDKAQDFEPLSVTMYPKGIIVARYAPKR